MLFRSVSQSRYENLERSNFGHIYIGSNITPSDLTNNTSSLISKTSSVFVGYQSNDTSVFSTVPFTPKGNASLNVAAPSDSVLNDLTTTLKPAGKALNIQKGDLVTANQDAGWIEVNLGSSPFLSGNVSECISANSQGSGAGPNSFYKEQALYLSGSSVIPRWIASYKVIGHTVFYKIELQSVLFYTTGPASNDSPYIYIGGDTLFSTAATGGVNSGKLPRPLVQNVTPVYPGTAGIGQYSYPNILSYNTVYSPSFFGNGYVSIRQNRNNTFPLNGSAYTGQGASDELLRVPINAGMIFDASQTWMQLMGIGAATYLWSDPGNYDNVFETQTMLDANYKKLVPFTGNRFNFPGTSSVPANTQIQIDIFYSGQYELDPQAWFV